MTEHEALTDEQLIGQMLRVANERDRHSPLSLEAARLTEQLVELSEQAAARGLVDAEAVEQWTRGV